MVSSTTATVGQYVTPSAALAPKILRMIAALIVASALGAAGCGSDSNPPPPNNPPPNNPPPDQPALRDATTADLQNMAFSFADGAAFDPALAGQAATLDIGAFDASNTAPFRLESNQLSTSGIATLNSPLTLDFRIVPAGLPFTGAPVSLDAKLDDNNVLSLDNSGMVSTASAAGIASASPPLLFPAQLSGKQEVPAPVITDFNGSFAATPSADGASVEFQLQYTIPAGVRQAHLHVGAPGENGGIILFLCATNLIEPAPVPADITQPALCPAAGTPLSGTLTAADIPTDGAVATFEEAVAAFAAGSVYVNVHTDLNPDGELRGQVGPATLQAGLSGTQEVPPVNNTVATGSGSLILNATQTQVSYNLSYEQLVGVRQAHIHVGNAGTNGGILLFLCATNKTAPAPAPEGSPDCPPDGTVLGGSLTAADFSATAGVNDFDAAVVGLLSGETYINVHTDVNPGGELRGQVGAATVQAQLSGDNVVEDAAAIPAIVAGVGTGSAAVRLNASQSILTYSMSYEILGQTEADIYVGGPLVNGQILFNLCDVVIGVEPQDCPPSQAGMPATISGTLSAANLDAAAPIDFAASVNALLSNTTYANLRSGGGDIRDQLNGLVSLSVQVQPIFDNNCVSCHGAAGGLSLEPGASHGNIVNVANLAGDRIRIIPGDPANSFLIERIEAGSAIPMPPDGALGEENKDPAAVELIKRWTTEGALNN